MEMRKFEQSDTTEEIKKERIAEIRKSADTFFEILNKEYFEFLNNLEDLEREIEGDDEKTLFLQEMLNFLDISKEDLKNIIDTRITGAVEKMYEMAQERNMDISQNNSVLDILRNSIITGISYTNKVIDIIREGKIKRFEDLTETKKQGLEYLKKSLVDVLKYIDLICKDEEKLGVELTSLDGLLGGSRKYFKKTEEGTTKFPSGGRKIAYIKLFDEITPENVRELVEKAIEAGEIDENILDTEKLIIEISGSEKNSEGGFLD